MATINDLRKRCKDLGLKPCGGKGVDRIFLEQLIAEHEATLQGNDYEAIIRQTNPDFYYSIVSLVPSLPDFRPIETLEKMELVSGLPPPQDNWALIYDELSALSRENPEGEEERNLFEALLNEEDEQIKELSSDNFLILRFLETYRALSWLLERLKHQFGGNEVLNFSP